MYILNTKIQHKCCYKVQSNFYLIFTVYICKRLSKIGYKVSILRDTFHKVNVNGEIKYGCFALLLNYITEIVLVICFLWNCQCILSMTLSTFFTAAIVVTVACWHMGRLIHISYKVTRCVNAKEWFCSSAVWHKRAVQMKSIIEIVFLLFHNNIIVLKWKILKLWIVHFRLLNTQNVQAGINENLLTIHPKL